MLLYLSVLLHEMSHALMAKRYGLPVKSITLHFLGGVTEIEGEPDTPRREFGVSVVGPLTSIAVGAVFAGLWFVTPDGLLLMAVEGLAGANLLVGVLNLIPGLPLDGGRVLRSAVWKVTGSPHTGTIVAGWGGRVAAVLALSYPLVIEVLTSRQPDLVDYLLAFVIATFLWGGASTAIISARLRRKLPTLRARSLARRTLAVPHDLPLSEAVRRAQQEQAGSIVVLDQHARPSGIVNEAALLATPEERRPWLPVEAVARSIEPGLMLPRRHLRGGPGPGDAAHPGDGVPAPRGRRRGVRRPHHLRRRPRLRGHPLAAVILLRMPTPEPAPVEPAVVTDEDDVTPETWSGVHRGPLRAGEWVRLTDTKGRRHNICLTAGKQFFTNRGSIDHDELIGRPEGFAVTSSAGGEYLVFRPLLSEFVVSMPRGAARGGPPPGRRPARGGGRLLPGRRGGGGGGGGGPAPCSLRGPWGRTGACRRANAAPRFAEVATRRTSRSSSTGSTRPGTSPSATSSSRFPRATPAGTVDRVILDMLAPWECVDAVADALTPEACVRLTSPPPPTQLGRTAADDPRPRRLPTTEPWRPCRDWHVEGLAVRPGHKMVGHTGFLVAAGDRGRPSRRRAAPPAPVPTASTTRGRVPPGSPAGGRGGAVRRLRRPYRTVRFRNRHSRDISFTSLSARVGSSPQHCCGGDERVS